MTEHTPTPWKLFIEQYGDEWWFGGEGEGQFKIQGSRPIGDRPLYDTIVAGGLHGLRDKTDEAAEQQANAEFIVRACNSHDEMVAVLEAWRQADEIAKRFEDAGTAEEMHAIHVRWQGALDAAQNLRAAVLAKAKKVPVEVGMFGTHAPEDVIYQRIFSGCPTPPREEDVAEAKRASEGHPLGCVCCFCACKRKLKGRGTL